MTRKSGQTHKDYENELGCYIGSQTPALTPHQREIECQEGHRKAAFLGRIVLMFFLAFLILAGVFAMRGCR